MAIPGHSAAIEQIEEVPRRAYQIDDEIHDDQRLGNDRTAFGRAICAERN